ncbi:MAG: hypothetical protein ABH827_06340 [bacterium]
MNTFKNTFKKTIFTVVVTCGLLSGLNADYLKNKENEQYLKVKNDTVVFTTDKEQATDFSIVNITSKTALGSASWEVHYKEQSLYPMMTKKGEVLFVVARHDKNPYWTSVICPGNWNILEYKILNTHVKLERIKSE